MKKMLLLLAIIMGFSTVYADDLPRIEQDFYGSKPYASEPNPTSYWYTDLPETYDYAHYSVVYTTPCFSVNTRYSYNIHAYLYLTSGDTNKMVVASTNIDSLNPSDNTIVTKPVTLSGTFQSNYMRGGIMTPYVGITYYIRSEIKPGDNSKMDPEATMTPVSCDTNPDNVSKIIVQELPEEK